MFRVFFLTASMVKKNTSSTSTSSQPHSESEPVKDKWFALIIDKEKDYIFIAAFGNSEEEVLTKARQRARSHDLPIITADLMREDIGHYLRDQLFEHDILGADNTNIIREIGQFFLDMMEEKRKQAT